MSEPRRRRRSGRPLGTGVLVHSLLLIAIAIWSGQSVLAQQVATSATLNDPSSATSTPSKGNGVNSNSTSSPASTSVVSVPLSTQSVPYLVKVPQSIATSNGQRDAYFTGCSDSTLVGYVSAQSRVNISTVYSQIDRYNGDSALGNGYTFSAGTLRVVGIGTVGNESYAFNSYTDSTGATTGLLSAIQVSTRFSTLPVFSNYTYLCNRLYPTQNDSQHPNVNPASCQFGPGTISFGIDVPLNSTYEAGSLMTEIRLTDSSSPALTIACIQLHTSSYIADRWYWDFIMWLPVALAIGFLFLSVLAALFAAEVAQRSAFKNRAREGGAPKLFRDRLGPMMVSALSGRGLVASPALLRFVTPGCWDIIYHLQFIVAIAMCHVQWPDFAYPFLRQAAWSTLLGNVTLTQSDHDAVNPLATDALLPSGDLGSQMSNATSPLYMNASQPNILLNLQNNNDGIETYASMIGLHSNNVFGTCLGIWLILVAAIVVLSGIVWVIDSFFEAHEKAEQRKEQAGLPLSSSPGLERTEEELKAWDKDKLVVDTAATPTTLTTIAGWRSAMGLHGKALHGNLIRALLLFHLPITIVSTYQFTLAKEHSTVSVALAALAFAFFSVLIPVYIITHIARTPVQKLYEHTGTLLAFGSAYHLYSPGSQLFYVVSFAHSLVLGVVVGAGQQSGSAQAIIILIVEVLAALASSLWLPWGEGAMMGPLSFMANVVRIISAILLVLLTSLVGLSFSARVWITYVVLLLQGIYIAGALMVILVKTTEALVRMIWKVRFDDGKTSIRTAGLGGAIRKIKRRKLKSIHRRSNSSSLRLQRIKMEHRMSGMSDGSTNTQSHMLRHAQHIPMSDARTGSYAEYLGTGMPRPPSSHVGSFNKLNEESGNIMAALPPVSPGGARMSMPSPGQGFIRTGGGKATDANPYAALPTQDRMPNTPPTQRPRPQSQSGIVGNWAAEGEGPRPVSGSYFAIPRTPPNEMTSTQVAALAARRSLLMKQQEQQLQNLQSQQQATKKQAGGKSFPWAKSKSKQEAEDEDGWSDEGMTWDSNAAAQGKGAWAGVSKMGAALTSLKKNILGGKGETGRGEEDHDETAGSLPPSGSGGFEVVRAARSQATPAKTDVPAVNIPATEAKTDNAAKSAQKEGADYGGHLGMLGADLERVASTAGYTEDGGDDRYWLPPLDLGSDQGNL